MAEKPDFTAPIRRAIDSRAVGNIRAALARGRHQHVGGQLANTSITIGAAVEIAGWCNVVEGSDSACQSIFDRIQKMHPTVSTARRMLAEPNASDGKLELKFGEAELRRISRLTTDDRGWWEYLERFSKAAENRGMDRTYSKALAATLHEMADNVVQHAGRSRDKMPANIAGWHVRDGVAAFVVLDDGCGVTTSLKENPRWNYLRDDGEALRRVVCDHATRKAGNESGDGYRTVVKNFVDRNGYLALRSGSAELVAKGELDQGVVTVLAAPHFRGTRVAAWCAPNNSSSSAEPTLE